MEFFTRGSDQQKIEALTVRPWTADGPPDAPVSFGYTDDVSTMQARTVRQVSADGPPEISWICSETNSTLSKSECKQQIVRPRQADRPLLLFSGGSWQLDLSWATKVLKLESSLQVTEEPRFGFEMI